MTNENAIAFIEHHGVTGMKWGVRKSRKSENSPAAKARKMTDAELKTAVDRLKLEQQYVQTTNSLNPPNPVRDLLKKHGGQAASIAVSATTSAIVGLAIKKAMDKTP